MVVDLLVTNGDIVTPEGRLEPGTAIAVRDGRIAGIGDERVLPDANEVLNLDGDTLVPGIIDCHIHTRSPGSEYREDWETSTRSAAAGGVTTVIAMPNTSPLVDRPEHLETVYDLIEDNAVVDAQSYGLVTSDNLEHLLPLAEAGVPGYKCFLVEGSQYDFKPPDDGELYEAMQEVAGLGRRMGFHEENDDIVSHFTAKFLAAGRNDPADQPLSRPVVAETEAVSRLCLFAEDTDCPVHMFHVSSGSAAEVVARAKRDGVDVTAETMPHYLEFTADLMAEKGNAAQVNPPLRSEAERERLWAVGIDGGAIDCLATDHAPYTAEEKGMDDPFQNPFNVYAGFVGLESLVPAMLRIVNGGRMSLKQWVHMNSRRPAQVWNMYPQKGSLQVGTDADFTVVDTDAAWTLARRELRSKSKVTPYDGETFTGKVTTTVVRGEVVFDGEQVVGSPGDGRVVDVNET